MSASLDCAEIERWQTSLSDELPLDQRARYESHLESCPACQERLDRAEGFDETLRKCLQIAGDPAAGPTDPTLVHVMERLCEARSPVRHSAAAPVDLYFLRPTDRPEGLGLLGSYEVVEVIGQGGMGLVLKAVDLALHRLVAIKVLAPVLAGSATARLRFTREAQAAAAISHDHVVVVHGVHEADGLPYLVMEYIAGESLQERIDRTGPLDLIEIVRIGHQTAAGLAAAHAQGLIHRDIKPANLLLENGLARVTITDFGLARAVDDVQLTQNGVVAGTPEYMSPEQARGDPIDHRSDVFSLGSVLYAMATGGPPFRGSTALAVLRHVSDQTPPPLRALNPNIPAWLETLASRLMAKFPDQRIQTAAEVAGLLEGYLAHLQQPATIAAPLIPMSPWENAARQPAYLKAIKALKRCLPGLGVAAVVLLAGLGLTRWYLGAGGTAPGPSGAIEEYSQPFKGAPESREGWRLEGPDAREYVHDEPDGLRITLPRGNQGERQGTGVAIVRAVKGDFEISLRFEILSETPPVEALARRPSTRFTVDAGVDREKRVVATLSRQVPVTGSQYWAWTALWNRAVGKSQGSGRGFPARAKTGRLRIARTGSVVSFAVAEGVSDQFIILRQSPFVTEDLEDIRIIASTASPDAALDVRITDFLIRAKVMGIAPTSGGPSSLAITVGLLVVLSLSLGAWFVVRLRRGADNGPRKGPGQDLPLPLPGAAEAISFQCSECDKKLKARAELAGKKVKCPGCGKPASVPVPAPSVPMAVLVRKQRRFSITPRWLVPGALAAAGTLLAAGWWFWFSQFESASLLNVTLGNVPVEGVEEAGFHNQEYDQNAEPFRWTDGHARLVIPLDKTKLPQALQMEIHAFRPPGKAANLKVLVNRRELFHDDLRNWKWVKTFDLSGIELGEHLEVQIVSDTYVPRGIMDGGANNDPRTLGVQVWIVKLLTEFSEEERAAARLNVNGAPLHVLRAHPLGISCGALTADGKTLVSGSLDGMVTFTNVATTQIRQRWPGFAPGMQALAVGPDGDTVAAPLPGGEVCIASGDPRKKTLLFPGHHGEITALAISPNGKTLAVAGGDRQRAGELKLWNLAAQAERVPIEPFKLRLWGLAYAPDGKTVAVASGDRLVYRVDTTTGKVVARLGHSTYARRVAFSADGQRLAVAYGDDGDVSIYEVNSGKLLSAIHAPGKVAMGLDFARTASLLAMACADGTATIWDVSKAQALPVTMLTGHRGPVSFALFVPDGRTILTGGADRTIRLWSVGGRD